MTKPSAERQMLELALAIHGVLAALHALGIVYNARRHNRFETIAHSAACAFDVYAVGKHMRQVAALNTPTPFVPNGICNDPTTPLDLW